MQKEFWKSCEGFLRAALTVHGHPGPVWKIAKMSLFDQCMEFDFFWPNYFIWGAIKVPFFDFIQKMSPSKCLSDRMNWIISRIPQMISKILFVYGSYEFLAMLKGKIREAPIFKVQFGKITVCSRHQLNYFRSNMIFA